MRKPGEMMPPIDQQVLHRRHTQSLKKGRLYVTRESPIKLGGVGPMRDKDKEKEKEKDQSQVLNQSTIISQISTPATTIINNNYHNHNESSFSAFPTFNRENKQSPVKRMTAMENFPKFRKPECEITPQPSRSRLRPYIEPEKNCSFSRDHTPTPSIPDLKPDTKIELLRTQDLLKRNQEQIQNKPIENSILMPPIKTPMTEKIIDRKKYTTKPSVIAILDKKKKCKYF